MDCRSVSGLWWLTWRQKRWELFAEMRVKIVLPRIRGIPKSQQRGDGHALVGVNTSVEGCGGPNIHRIRAAHPVRSPEPGIRHQLEYSQDLGNWEIIGGFPSEAEALVRQHAFEKDAGGRGFCRVGDLDEQAPEIVLLSPGNNVFGAGRFSAATVAL